jgi:hypothetical protein
MDEVLSLSVPPAPITADPVPVVPSAAFQEPQAAPSISPLSGHGVALALRGAVLAARDPAGYRAWLRRTALEHAPEEGRLHAAARI